ncbi:MAG: DUF896 domain-containing protein [Lachnospiraceae bacterium]|nr:DUF896 domain-containing protein [Lachnospiraceae bacterium]
MNQERLNRINELYHKSKTEGLTEEERIEQAELRAAYIQEWRNGMRSTLNSISIVEPDGSITELKKKYDPEG